MDCIVPEDGTVGGNGLDTGSSPIHRGGLGIEN